ncbi:MAG TPA: GNAT family N-acetyltransferase [Niastella sp.]
MSIVVNPRNKLYTGPELELKNKTTDPETSPRDGYSIELICGSAVIDLLLNPGFQKSWDMLFESCPWATVFQSRAFITACYQVYREVHIPIIVSAMEGGQLKGLLPMALLNTNPDNYHVAGKNGRITGPGHYEAEYQTWLAAPSDAESFIKKALAEIMKEFPGHHISFRFLPAGTPLDWIKEDNAWRKCCIVQDYDLPVISFKDPEPAQIFKRKHFKNKLNRLKKFGEVHFETITNLERFKSIFDELILLYDFRQNALFNKLPFYADPVKKDFLLELFRLNMLHVTLLRADEKTIAAVVAVKGLNGAVHLAGMNCHSPFKARSYSPGFIHFILLAKQLSEEHVSYFDLSPGYDAYKDDLANEHVVVKELVITTERAFHLKRKIRNWIHARLIAAGKRPMSVELDLKRYLYLFRHCNTKFLIKRLAKSLGKKGKQQLYGIQPDQLPSNVKTSFQKDNLSDLLDIEPGKGTGVTRWEFMGDAMYRLETGQHAFTWVENGRLLCCAWFKYPDNSVAENDNKPAAETAIVLESCYYEGEGKDRLADLVNSVVTDIADKKEGVPVYFRASDPLFCKALQLAGSQIA